VGMQSLRNSVWRMEIFLYLCGVNVKLTCEKMTGKWIGAALLAAAMAMPTRAQNPYLPLWEHIPDGEAYVFDDPDRPGRQRVYLYGSHDNLRTEYCGRDLVVWSAPVEDLTQWRYDGVIFKSQASRDGKPFRADGKADVLYAPDVAVTVESGRKVYYLCPNNQEGGRQTMVARSDRPDGPFSVCNWAADGVSTEGVWGFDPSLFCDDDGRVYGYWGFERSYAAELDPRTMCTPLAGTRIVEDMISSNKQRGASRFFEASSMKKILGKYVFIYSRITEPGEFGLPSTNYTLAYAYGDSPLGPFTYGGTIIDGRGRDTDEQGHVIVTGYRNGNTHGTLAEVNGRWWVFFHRQSGTNEFARQPMVAPVEVQRVGDAIVISEAEVTSEGFQTDGLNPLERQPAGIACYLTHPEPMTQEYPGYVFKGSYVAATYVGDNDMDGSYSLNTHHAPLVNNTAGSVAGYKYFNFDHLASLASPRLCLEMRPLGVKGEIVAMVDSPWESKGGRVIGRMALTGDERGEGERAMTLTGLDGLGGKHALYLRFESATPGASLCDVYSLVFRP